MCKKCVNTLLPFSSIDNSEFNFIFGNYNRIPNDNDIERLSELKFNPFDENISTARTGKFVPQFRPNVARARAILEKLSQFGEIVPRVQCKLSRVRNLEKLFRARAM
jgi:hypothetical protein